MTEPHDVPTAAQLVEAVREFLERDVMANTEGRVQFHARVAVNALNMVQRELEVGAVQAADHRERLAHLGVADEATFAAAIRSGALDDRRAEVFDVLRETVRAKLEVANPKYLSANPDKPPGS
jgi:ABC-type sulfate/molybdate transport systems ATPase subunit